MAGMGYRLFFDRAQRILVVRFGAALTAEALIDMRAAVKRFVAKEGTCPALLDFTAVEKADVPGHFIADLARSGPIIKGAMRVLVAPNPEVFGLSRMYELHQFQTSDETLVVRTLDEAYEALGVKALALKEIEP